MAAYRQAKRMQRGALTAQGGFSTTDPALLQVPCTIQCVFIPRIVLEYAQTIFTTTTGSVSPRVDLTSTSKLQFFVGITSNVIPVDLDKLYNIVFVVDTNIQSVYVNGELLKNAEYSISSLAEYSIGSKNNNSDRFQGDYLLHRHFNYAMSADEVKALDNNNDPMGYVVPKAKRDSLLAEYLPQNLMESRKGPEVEPAAEIFEFNLETAQYLNIFQINNNLFYCVYRIDYTVDEWEFDPAPSQFVGFGGKPGVTLKGNIKFNTLEDAKIGEQQSFYAYLTEGTFRGIDLYAGSPQESSTARRLKVTIKGITPVSVPISWLDSAKQMPLSDEYMEPLFQSIGGYDMAANGAPEILYNE